MDVAFRSERGQVGLNRLFAQAADGQLAVAGFDEAKMKAQAGPT